MLVTFPLSLLGLADAIYLTITHFDKAALVCNATGHINCELVTRSRYSEIFGHIPVAILGLAYYLVVASPQGCRAASRQTEVDCTPYSWAAESGLAFGARQSQGTLCPARPRYLTCRGTRRGCLPWAAAKSALRCRRASASANKRSQRLTMVKE
jgi:hypothetical protein